MGESVFCVSFDERLDKSCFSNARRTDDGNDDRRRFGREAIDKRNMEALFFDL